jgi:hypothetical protein
MTTQSPTFLLDWIDHRVSQDMVAAHANVSAADPVGDLLEPLQRREVLASAWPAAAGSPLNHKKSPDFSGLFRF